MTLGMLTGKLHRKRKSPREYEENSRTSKYNEDLLVASERVHVHGNCYQNFVSLYFEVREFSSYSRILVEIFVFLCNFPVNIPKVFV